MAEEVIAVFFWQTECLAPSPSGIFLSNHRMAKILGFALILNG